MLTGMKEVGRFEERCSHDKIPPEGAGDAELAGAYTYGKGRQGRHSDVPGVGPEVALDPKYYQNDNVIWIKVDFIVKFYHFFGEIR